jgi:threonine dehydrogenase-like Zn-dependent dehydrogenase
MTPYGLGPDVVLETAGVPAAFSEALQMVRQSGSVIEAGHFSFRGNVATDPSQICRKNLSILGVFCYARPSDLGKAVRLMDTFASRVPWGKAVTHHYPLDQAQAALDAAHRQEGLRIAIVP